MKFLKLLGRFFGRSAKIETTRSKRPSEDQATTVVKHVHQDAAPEEQIAGSVALVRTDRHSTLPSVEAEIDEPSPGVPLHSDPEVVLREENEIEMTEPPLAEGRLTPTAQEYIRVRRPRGGFVGGSDPDTDLQIAVSALDKTGLTEAAVRGKANYVELRDFVAASGYAPNGSRRAPARRKREALKAAKQLAESLGAMV